MGAAVAELVSAGTEAEAVPVAKPDGPAALAGAELVPLVMGKTGAGLAIGAEGTSIGAAGEAMGDSTGGEMGASAAGEAIGALGASTGAAEEAGGASIGALGASMGAAGASMWVSIGAAGGEMGLGSEMGVGEMGLGRGMGVGVMMLTGGPWALGFVSAGAWIWPSAIWETWALMARGRRRRVVVVREGRILIDGLFVVVGFGLVSLVVLRVL